MVIALDPDYVKTALQSLSARSSDIFGATAHRFQLNPVLDESLVRNFEREHKITLPAEYRNFITQIGNGGAGPYYGVFRLGEMDGLGDSLQTWGENDGFVGVLSAPFPFSAAWNDVTGKPGEDLLEKDEAMYWKAFEKFDETYFGSALVNGAIPICHEGCALRI